MKLLRVFGRNIKTFFIKHGLHGKGGMPLLYFLGLNVIGKHYCKSLCKKILHCTDSCFKWVKGLEAWWGSCVWQHELTLLVIWSIKNIDQWNFRKALLNCNPNPGGVSLNRPHRLWPHSTRLYKNNIKDNFMLQHKLHQTIHVVSGKSEILPQLSNGKEQRHRFLPLKCYFIAQTSVS